MSLYTKNKAGEFIPVEVNNILNTELNNSLIIIRIGSDDFPASMEDLKATADSFTKADVISDLDNVSIILTPYQLSIDLVSTKELENKKICLQIIDGDDISMLDQATKSLYKNIKKKHKNVVIIPSPLTVRDYRQFKDTIERCKMKKRRRLT